MNSQIHYKKWPSPTQSHHTSELAVLIPLIPFSQGEGNILYSRCFIKAFNLPENNSYFPCERHNPWMCEHHKVECFVPESPFQNIGYFKTLSTAVNHQFSSLEFTTGEKLRLKNHTHNTHPWSLGLASAGSLNFALNIQYQSDTAIWCQVICPTVLVVPVFAPC